MALTKDEVFDKVRDVLVDALGADEDEVVNDARLVADLGAESIDFLDIVFRLEKTFGIKIEQGEMIPDNVLQDSNYVLDGNVTDNGMEELRKRLPHADLDEFDATRKVDDFIDIFTVDTIVTFVESKL
jgi:acyl carrier protein